MLALNLLSAVAISVTTIFVGLVIVHQQVVIVGVILENVVIVIVIDFVSGSIVKVAGLVAVLLLAFALCLGLAVGLVVVVAHKIDNGFALGLFGRFLLGDLLGGLGFWSGRKALDVGISTCIVGSLMEQCNQIEIIGGCKARIGDDDAWRQGCYADFDVGK